MPKPSRITRWVLVAGVVAGALITFWAASRFRGETASKSYLRTVKNSSSDIAIVFVHGVFGTGDDTFRARNGAYWPTLLTEDPLFKDAAIYVYGYSSDWSAAGLSISQLAGDMHQRLRDAGVLRHKRIVFVCHSMGGLVTRSYITEFAQEIRDKVAFLYFFSTPSSGADIARVGRALLKNTQLANMSPRSGEAFLRDLQSRWINAGFSVTLRSYCAYETVPTAAGIVVPWASAFALCNSSVIAIERNHMGIVKPESVLEKPHTALRTAYDDFLRSVGASAMRLIPATSFSIRYQPDGRKYSLTFRGAVKSVGGSVDAVTNVYALVMDVSSREMVPFSATEATCKRADQEVAVPFVLGSADVTCTFTKSTGDISFTHLSSPGPKRASVTFETDDHRGYTAQYCFVVDEDDARQMASGPLARRFLFSLCDQ